MSIKEKVSISLNNIITKHIIYKNLTIQRYIFKEKIENNIKIY